MLCISMSMTGSGCDYLSNMIMCFRFHTMSRITDDCVWCVHMSRTIVCFRVHTMRRTADECVWCVHMSRTIVCFRVHSMKRTADECVWCVHVSRTKADIQVLRGIVFSCRMVLAFVLVLVVLV